MAEVHYGAAKDHPGLVLLTTLGTGIGSALIYRGVLIPNSELGHLEIDGHDAESRAASSVKDKKGCPTAEWAKRLQRYYERVEALLWPDLIVIGGGVSKDVGQVPAEDLESTPRSCRRSCSTPPASSVPPGSPPTARFTRTC